MLYHFVTFCNLVRHARCVWSAAPASARKPNSNRAKGVPWPADSVSFGRSESWHQKRLMLRIQTKIKVIGKIKATLCGTLPGTTIQHGEMPSAKPLLVTQRSLAMTCLNLGTEKRSQYANMHIVKPIMPSWEIPRLSSETWDSANQAHAGKRLYNTSANMSRASMLLTQHAPGWNTETSWEQLILLNWVHVRRVSDVSPCCWELGYASCLRYALNPRHLADVIVESIKKLFKPWPFWTLKTLSSTLMILY